MRAVFFRLMLAVSPVLFALQETVMLPVLRRWSPPAEIMEPMFEMPVVWPICSSAYRYICIPSRNSRDFRNGRNDARLVGEGKVEERERGARWDLAGAVGRERIYSRTCSI